MEVDSVGFIVILSMSYITTRIVKTYTSVAEISRMPVENQITTLSVVKIAIKFSPCRGESAALGRRVPWANSIFSKSTKGKILNFLHQVEKMISVISKFNRKNWISLL